MTLRIWAAGRGNKEPNVGTQEALESRPTRHFYIIEYIVTSLWKFQQKLVGPSIWVSSSQSAWGISGAVVSQGVTGAEKPALIYVRAI